MTIIAANRNEMACDSQITRGNHKYDGGVKIEQIGDCLIGCCGYATDIASFFEWIQNPDTKKPRIRDSFCALVLTPAGFYEYDSALIPLNIEENFFAIGSGADYALGAMANGATPTEAAKIASKFDIASGGRIHTKALQSASKPYKRTRSKLSGKEPLKAYLKGHNQS